MHDIPPMHNELVAATQENGPYRREGARRERQLFRLAGSRECDR